MTATLLTTKLHVPSLREEHVVRPRLTRLLDAGWSRKLTLVSAPAGFGKTTLLAEWIRSQPVAARDRSSAFAWLSLDQGDNDPVRFWSYLIAALQTTPFLRAKQLDEALAATVRSFGAVAAPAPLSWEGLLCTLINEIATVPRPLVLVLDDLQVITEPQIHQGLVYLIENMPATGGGMHLVVASRSDPPWPLARLRARGQVAEVRVAELRFTLDETAAFLNEVAGLRLSAEDIATLDSRTEGWVAGLQMAALSMKGFQAAGHERALSAFVEAFTGSHRYVLDYLVEEVLDRQPPEVQEFLLKTSVLEHLTAPLCDAVCADEDAEKPEPAGGSQAMLRRLEADNLFLLALDDERRWFRYHPLFADLLQRRLGQRIGPEGVALLHERASRWYEQGGLTTEAIGHALASGNVEGLARLVERNALAAIFQGQRATVVRWLEALPDGLVRSRPWLCLAYAWVLASSGRWDGVESLLADAERSSGLWEVDRGASQVEGARHRRSEDPEAKHLAGHLLALHAYATGIKGDIDTARELARSALACVPEEDRAVRSFAASLLGSTLAFSGDLAGAAEVWTQALAESRSAGDVQDIIVLLGSLAALAVEQGQLRKAAEISHQILELGRQQAGRGGWSYPLLGPTHSRLSRIYLEWNDLAAALEQAQEGVRLTEAWGHLEAWVTGHVALAQVFQALGDEENARTTMREAVDVAGRLSPWYRARTAADEARMWLAQGNLPAVERWAAASGTTIDDEPSFDRLDEYPPLALMLVAQGKGGDALAMLARFLQATQAIGALRYVVEALAIKAVALQQEHATEEALSTLATALACAEPEGFVWTFISLGKAMELLLRGAATQGIAPGYVRRLLEACEAAEARRTGGPARAESETAQTGKATPEVRGPVPRPSPLVEPLSERETEVLRLLATSLSVPEIAERLVVSASTVRSHVKSIYGKLDAHSRIEALERARELFLIPDHPI